MCFPAETQHAASPRIYQLNDAKVSGTRHHRSPGLFSPLSSVQHCADKYAALFHSIHENVWSAWDDQFAYSRVGARSSQMRVSSQ